MAPSGTVDEEINNEKNSPPPVPHPTSSHAFPSQGRRGRRRFSGSQKKKKCHSNFSHARDFLFCPDCGTLLALDSPQHVRCLRCNSCRPSTKIAGRETRYTITAEDIRRQLKIIPLVQIDMPVDDENVKWAVTNRMCPACKHPELEYTNKQLRSADEGQTTFYRCPECGHNFNENS